MSRYIDADKLIPLLEDYYNAQVLSPTEYLAGLQKSLLQVKVFSEKKTEDVEPVRHGHWIYRWRKLEDRYQCSICAMEGFVKWYYCPYCGAKIDKKEETT